MAAALPCYRQGSGRQDLQNRPRTRPPRCQHSSEVSVCPIAAGVGRTTQEGCRGNRRGRQPKREIVAEGIEKRARSSFGCHSERKYPVVKGHKYPELQGYKRRVATAENRDCSLRLRSPVPAPQLQAGQAAFAAVRLTCDKDRFSMVSLRRFDRSELVCYHRRRLWPVVSSQPTTWTIAGDNQGVLCR